MAKEPGTIEKMNQLDTEYVGIDRPIRFWLTVNSFIECLVTDGVLNVRSVSGTGALVIEPEASNSVNVRIK